MSGFFCNSPRLQLLERQMRQPPGYRPRGQGWMFDMEEWKSRGNYSEIVDCVISRMQMEHLIHLSLVYRGDSQKAAQFIEAQDLVLEELLEETTEEEEVSVVKNEVPRTGGEADAVTAEETSADEKNDTDMEE